MTFVVGHFCVFVLVRCKVAGFIYSRKLLTTSYLLEKGNTRLLSAFMKVLPVCFFCSKVVCTNLGFRVFELCMPIHCSP